MALVAAMRPKSNGSSTIGVKKSVVATSACESLSRYTAASSAVSVPTRRSFGRPRIGVEARISERTAGAILQPQPPPWLNWVSRIFSGAFMARILQAAGAKAAEHVAAIRHVEIAERGPQHAPRRGEARAAQHLVRAEPGLEVIGVGIDDETGVALERAGGPFPDRSPGK